jgi:glycosyltransferase involved in cell wall biosynthesis
MKLAIKAGATAHKVVLAPNGIGIDDVENAGEDIHVEGITGSKPSRLRMLYVGRLSAEKGVKTLLAACGLLTKWKVDYSLTVVGTGPRGKTLSDLAHRSGISNRIKFVRPVPRGHLGAYYRSTDVLCVPSLDEPLGNVVLEGLISGCLVVGSELGGIRFIISDGIDGYLVPPDKPRKWAEKLFFISENKGNFGSLVNNGREMVRRRFDWENIVLGMHEAISKTIARG